MRETLTDLHDALPGVSNCQSGTDYKTVNVVDYYTDFQNNKNNGNNDGLGFSFIWVNPGTQLQSKLRLST